MYHSHDADLLAASRTGGAGACWHLENSHVVLSNLAQIALNQAPSSAFKVLEQELTTSALHFDDTPL